MRQFIRPSRLRAIEHGIASIRQKLDQPTKHEASNAGNVMPLPRASEPEDFTSDAPHDTTSAAQQE